MSNNRESVTVGDEGLKKKITKMSDVNLRTWYAVLNIEYTICCSYLMNVRISLSFDESTRESNGILGL